MVWGLFVTALGSLPYLIQTSKDKLITISSRWPISSRLRGIWVSWKQACLPPSLVFLAARASCWPAQLAMAARARASSWNFWNKEGCRCSLQVTPWKFTSYWREWKVHFLLFPEWYQASFLHPSPQLVMKCIWVRYGRLLWSLSEHGRTRTPIHHQAERPIAHKYFKVVSWMWMNWAQAVSVRAFLELSGRAPGTCSEKAMEGQRESLTLREVESTWQVWLEPHHL